jgi:hypothetical protein
MRPTGLVCAHEGAMIQTMVFRFAPLLLLVLAACPLLAPSVVTGEGDGEEGEGEE